MLETHTCARRRGRPDCGEPLEAVELQGTDALGTLSIVSDGPNDGLLGGLCAGEIITPVPCVRPECRRALVYAV
ncbi:hypothetical protein EXE48_17770 [Halorubrum sp. ASP1]|nr:hypothetical protein EXE48_17770 [Halorubrum sp. ASP1]